MSEKDFKEARRDLQLSQRIMESLQQPAEQAITGQNAPQDEGMPQEAPMEPEMAEEAPVEAVEVPEEQTKGIVDGVIQGLKEFFTKKEEEPKEAVLKINAEVEPKKEE